MAWLCDGFWGLVLCLSFGAPMLAAAVIGTCVLVALKWHRVPVLWRRMQLSRLHGITTLEQELDDDCTICVRRMLPGEKVRTLSCGHAFHCGGMAGCGGVDFWLTEVRMECPVCRGTPHPVPPPLEEPLLVHEAQDVAAA